MKIKIIITLSPNTIINISINYYDILFNNRNFLFEFKLITFFDKNNEVFVYVIDCLLTFMQVKNIIETFIVLFKNIKLNIMIKYITNDYYQIFYKLADLTICE